MTATYDPAAGQDSGMAAQQLRLPVGWYESIERGSGAAYPISGDATAHYGVPIVVFPSISGRASYSFGTQ